MNKIRVFCLFFCFTNIVCGQDTIYISSKGDNLKFKTDTVIFDSFLQNHILYGTTLLPETEPQQVVRNYGLFLESINKWSMSDKCFLGDNQILYIGFCDDSLIVKVNIWGNSCHNYLCDVAMSDENTLNLIAHGYGSSCFCKTNHLLTYKFRRENFVEFSNIKYVSFNNEGKIPMTAMDNIVKYYLNSWVLSSNPEAKIGSNPLYIIDGITLQKSGFTVDDLKKIKDVTFVDSSTISESAPNSSASSCIIVKTQ